MLSRMEEILDEVLEEELQKELPNIKDRVIEVCKARLRQPRISY